MPLKTLSEIESEINRIAILLGANEPPDGKESTWWWDSIPVCGNIQAPGYRGTGDTGVARILVEQDGYHLFGRDRGAEYSLMVTEDFETLLFFSFEDVIHYMATNHAYATNNSWPGLTPQQAWYRRTYAREVDLYALISPALAQRHIAKFPAHMQQFLHDDNRTARVNRFREKLAIGPSRAYAWEAAHAQFPHIEITQPPTE